MKCFIVTTIVLFFICLQLPAQKQIYEGIMLTGTVRDSATNKPVKKAEIIIKESAKKGITDKNGCYRLIVFTKPDSLFIYHKNYQARRIKLIKLNNDFLLVKKK
jgi:hypothetical protein